MSIYFISSPGQLAHRALSLLYSANGSDDLTVVTTQEIKSFLEDKITAKIIVLKTETNLITKNTKHKILTNAIKSKLEYRRLFKGVKYQGVYLFYTSWGIVPISYVKKLSKKNVVFLYPENFLDNMYTEQKGLLAFVMRLAVRVLLGLKVYIVKWNDTPVWELKLNSFPMTIINEDMFGNKVPKEFMLDPNTLKDKKVLFLGSRFEIDCEETKDKVVLTNNLMDMLRTEFKGQYSIKAHPIDKTLYGTMKSSQYIIPAHILAESLWGHNWEFVIGYHSEALVSAKLNTKAKVISLIKMYEFTNPKVRQYWLDTFEKNGILMPSNLEELKCNMMITKKEKS